jgi:hypothetical protein
MTSEQLASARANNEFLINMIGSGRTTDKGGLQISDLANSSSRILAGPDEFIHPPETLALTGSEVWVGGRSYIACVDLKSAKVRKFCYVPAASVSGIRIAGGYAWAHCDDQLYRIPLN